MTDRKDRMTTPRTQRREVAAALEHIDAAQRSLGYIAAHLADVHSLAYEPPVAGKTGGGSGGVSDKAGEFATGKPTSEGARARAICETVIGSGRHSSAREAANLWGKVASDMQGILGGSGVVSGMRGTLIGSAEYEAALAAQRRRAARAGDPSTEHLAEYEPTRSAGQVQPRYPGPSAVPVPKSTAARLKRGWRSEPNQEGTG